MTIAKKYQLYSIGSYYLAFLLKMTLVLTIILTIKSTTFLDELYLLIMSQMFEYSCSNLFVRFPVGYDRANYIAMVPIVCLIFIVSNLVSACVSINILMNDNVSYIIYFTCCVILARTVFTLVAYFALLFITKFCDNIYFKMITDVKELIQYLECNYSHKNNNIIA